MKKTIQNIIIVFLIILELPFFILTFSELTGIGKKEGSFKFYEALSPTKTIYIICVIGMILFWWFGRK